MKKTILFILMIAAFIGLKAQENDYTMKLDSVIGSDNFDWSRWKSVYSYSNELGFPVQEEIRYEWESQAWMPKEKIETGTYDDDAMVQTNSYRWTGEDWEYYLQTIHQYNIEDPQQLQHIVVYNINDTLKERYKYTTYDYDALNRLTLVMNYNGTDTVWVESSKYEYTYNADGLLDTTLYSTIRNGNWRESQRTIYTYNELQQCVGILFQSKGGWGPFGNSWMDAYLYEFEYEDGELVSERYYTAGGWFGGGEMNLEAKNEYEFDANGNLLRKTGSIFNGDDWIVRDLYENRFDLTVDASKVQGLEQFWQSTVKNGMGYANGDAMSLSNQWLACSIISSERDTEFTLYCSGFEAVDEQQVEEAFKAYSFEGRLVVECVEPTSIVVYDLMGRVVAQKSQHSRFEFNLPYGLYILSNGSARMKVIVK